MSVINTNTISLNAQRNLATNSASLSTSIQRLSSGLRINSAKDDAAGLAISERFTTQIRGMNQAARNANDGISLAQTAEGALGEIGNNLQRIRELAVQSRNATNSTSDRQALDAEVQQLKLEIQRVAEQTQFNGTNLLDGSFTGAVFQVGANQGQTISVDNIANASTASLGGDWSRGARHESDSLTAATVTDGTLAASITINDQVIAIDPAAGRSEADALAALATRFAEVKAGDGAGALANVSMAADGTISFTDASVVVAGLTNVAGVTATTHNNTRAELSPAFTGTGFADEDILTAANADRMILAMDAALDAVNSSRADLGAIQNRFSSVVANLQTSSENLSASRSRIMDTDFAKETAELSRTQVLQQAGTAMLAQANQLPNNVLSLLR